MTSAAHERYVEYRQVAPPSNRSFGLTVGAILLAFVAIRALLGHGGLVTTILLSMGAALVLVGLVAPDLLGVFNRMWMALGRVLAAVINPIIMLLIFVVLFVPIALIMKLKGRDILQLTRKAPEASYWHQGSGTAPEERLKDQF